MSFTLSYEPPPVVRKSVSRKEPVVKDLPGVGYKISQDLLERLNVRTLHQLQQVAREQLQVVCGMKTGDLLYNSCRGIDETTLAADRDKARQSVSAEISWGVRFENHQQVDVFMRDLAQEVSKRLKEIDRKGKSIIMKRKAFVKGAWKHLGHGPVDQFARTGQLPLYTDDPDLIANEALRLLNYFRFDVLDLRGLGIQVLKLNNDVVNTVSKAAFAFPETKNQTTLTSAMFQQKSTAVNPRAVDDSEPSLQLPSATAAQELLHPTVERRVEPEKPIMEIDKGIFKELPKDIQDELLRDHNLVFLNEDISDASGGGPVAMVEGRGTSVAEQQASAQKHELTPWSQLDPRELMVLSTPAMRNALKEYAELKQTDRGKGRRSSITDTTSSRPPPATTLDRSVLQALPPEIRAEIEQEYTHIMENHELIRKLAQPGGSGGGSGSAGTSTGLQSRAPTTMAMTVGHDHFVPDHQVTSRPKTPGRGKPRGRPRGSRARGGRGRGAINEYPERVDDVHHSGGSTTATNFQAQVKKAPAAKIQQQQPDVPELDADFLAALPQDIRAEVEAAHRVELIKTRRRQEAELAAQRDAASAATRQGSGGGAAGTGLNERQQGPVLERPTLMGKREIGDLRVLLTLWVQSTLVEQDLRPSGSRRKDEAKEGGDGRGGGVEMTVFDEGPNPDDVQSFVDFVARVLVMERDLERVRLLLRYLRRRIEDNERQIEQDVRVKGGKPVEVGVAMTWRQAFEWVLSVAKQLVVHIYGGSFDLD
ncbi:deoxycytidyl transferase [Linnemannia elongata]|nr:deoxycytidyl transferase [Linnemannia elongata]